MEYFDYFISDSIRFYCYLSLSEVSNPCKIPTLVLKGTTNGISRSIVIERICFVDIGGPPLSVDI